MSGRNLIGGSSNTVNVLYIKLTRSYSYRELPNLWQITYVVPMCKKVVYLCRKRFRKKTENLNRETFMR